MATDLGGPADTSMMRIVHEALAALAEIEHASSRPAASADADLPATVC